MPTELDVDGSFFTFADGWSVEKIDEWPFQRSLTAEPFNAKACDLVAVRGDTMWMIEAKDYTYDGAQPPRDLARTVAVKIFHSLAILHAAARWDHSHAAFSRDALNCKTAHVALAVELPDGGRRLQGVEQPLAHLRSTLKAAIRALGVSTPSVTNHLVPDPQIPWSVRRDPARRSAHRDR